METERLRLLVELERLGSMRAVADELGTTTSRVSQQLAVLTREMTVPLLEPVGRRVRLTSAGRRLADRGRVVLAEVEAARSEAAGSAEPAGLVRVAAFATAIRVALIPVMRELAIRHPLVQLALAEQEPADAGALLLTDAVDLAVVYDYDLAPAARMVGTTGQELWSTEWALGVREREGELGATSLEVVRRHRDSAWIGNSRNSADEQVIRTLTSMAGFEPRLVHRCDDLDAVADLIAAGHGVGLLPTERQVPAGVRLVPLRAPGVSLRARALFRTGRDRWPALQAVLQSLPSALPS